MWGKSFTYEKSDNCMMMWFEGKNPNGDVTPNPNGDVTPRSSATCCSMFLCPAVILSLIILVLSSY